MANLIRLRKKHHYGLGEPVRFWGEPPRPHWCGFPHSLLHQDGSREEGRRIKSSVLDSDANCRSRLSIAKGIGNRESGGNKNYYN
ncbi:MAG: hypothetical protein F6K63_20780 [Moorea sp. SIO1G6]|uniref:hypothetical protein n=1 Tax=Moorena sp. SIO1G6 TaxID=2607840 RepID=UPI0013C095A4|nr:hypothetical protein [Moorena sp. SIO1G6]NET66688.1 hypothetical protein [Moorena sp. SIO1G6]